MQKRKPEITQLSRSSRRDFLKTTVAAGAVLAGGTGTGAASVLPVATVCKFTALPTGFTYLNSGTEGSMPQCVISNYQNHLQQWASNPTTAYELDPILGKRQLLNRQKVAGYFCVEQNNICLTDNTTMGCAMTITGLNLGRGDSVVTTNHEHNAIKSPLQVLQHRHGLKIETCDFPPAEKLSQMGAQDLLDSLFPDVPALRAAKALCVSHVYPTTGVRLPLRLLRKKADQLGICYLVVDGAQAMGMLDLGAGDDALEYCDFYAGSGHKWMNGPPSTGILYIRNANIRPPEFFPMVSQRMGKYLGYADDSSSRFPMAEALQVRGCSNTPGFAAMVKALEFARQEGGAGMIEKHILELSAEVKNVIISQAPSSIVSPHQDPALHSGLTTFFPFKWDRPKKLFYDKKTADRVVSELLAKNIQVRSIGVPDPASANGKNGIRYVIRVSTGYFNSSAQVKLFASALKQVL